MAVEQDLKQLLRLMLFNRAINNTDDHERNFSFMRHQNGYRLAPAYDLVPSLGLGEYHAAGFGFQPYPPPLKKQKNKVKFLAKQRRCTRNRPAG